MLFLLYRKHEAEEQQKGNDVMKTNQKMMNDLLNDIDMPHTEYLIAAGAKKFSVSKLGVAIKLCEFCIHVHYLSYDRNKLQLASIRANSFVKKAKTITAKKANRDVKTIFNKLTKRETLELDDACHHTVQNLKRTKDDHCWLEPLILAYICAHSNRHADVKYVVDSMFRMKINFLDVMSSCNANFVFSSRSNDNNITQIQVI